MYSLSAVALLLADVIASLALSGRLGGARAKGGATAAVLIAALALGAVPTDVRAQGAQGDQAAPEAEEGQGEEVRGDDAAAILAASEVTLAHVLTGDR